MACGPYAGVRRIVVLRPCALGDLMFALPALGALRETYPDASITLLGLPWQADFLAGRPGPIDEVRVVPTIPGVGAPPDAAEDGAAVAALLAGLNEGEHGGVDLAIQLYGGGRYSNPFLQRIGARHTLGMRAPDAPPLERTLRYVYLQNERLRLLEVVGLAGARTAALEPRLTVLPRDRAEAAAWLGADDGAPWVVVQPGATDPRRRWRPERFAAVADALAAAGARIAVNGGPDERAVVAAVIAAMRSPAVDLAAAGLSRSGLVGAIARAALVLSNDTGPLHLAQALGTASIGIYWFSNLLISGPLFTGRHRHAVALDPRCPVCGQDNVGARCAHDVSFVDAVSVDAVRDQALALLAEVLTSRSSASSSTA